MCKARETSGLWLQFSRSQTLEPSAVEKKGEASSPETGDSAVTLHVVTMRKGKATALSLLQKISLFFKESLRIWLFPPSLNLYLNPSNHLEVPVFFLLLQSSALSPFLSLTST